jgi:lysophospholipase
LDASHTKIRSADGTQLHIATWTPPAPTRTLLITHGLAEHMGRYKHVAETFCGAGYRVVGVELRGHGDSEGKRGHVDAWSQYCDDLGAALEFVGEPCDLLAHSMGGLVALDRLRDDTPVPVRNLVLTNPLVGVRVQAPAIKVALAGLLSKLLPGLSLSNELETEAISRDPEVVKAYQQDPRVFGTITPRWYTEMNQAMERVHKWAPSMQIPLLMVTSDADRICDPNAARRLTRAWGGSTEQLRYPELYHEVLNEPEREQVMAEILAWLDTSVAAEGDAEEPTA